MKVKQFEYLSQYYLSKSEVANLLGVKLDHIDQAILLGYMPKWAYKTTVDSCTSAAFGLTNLAMDLNEEYFCQATLEWYLYFTRKFGKPTYDQNTSAKIRQHFMNKYMQIANDHSEFCTLLDIGNMPLTNVASTAWVSHHLGMFGVTVTKADSINSIIEKQLIVKKLSIATENGQKKDYTNDEMIALIDLFQVYNRVAKTVSPVDYDRSNRKLLVDNVIQNWKV
ncbi:DUF6058 family natural product biosynthesis protein [Vibrio sp. 10N.261.49.A12]|uniref:DUF6058 family natural product biosynthesis protein n=1 Tax=Vibrio sp. 10N.261.49.A12 TaxID=3229667 RepID=UPI00355302D9